MYELNDTIVAVSSPTSWKRVIVRISGPDTVDTVSQIFSPYAFNKSQMVNRKWQIANGDWREAMGDKRALICGSVAIDAELRIDAKLYLFLAPHSYTGECLAEIHIHANPSVTKAFISNLLGKGLRMAGPGEFTARSFLNGKIDLSQAEAVNEIIISSNRFQLAAAERLFSGRLAETTEKIRSQIMDCLSLIEAGLDFSGEDIEFITRGQSVERLAEIKEKLEQLLDGSICYESVIDLPAVGIAGAPNAGKSSLLNELLGLPRSIVSAQRKTTRDVLTGELTLRHCSCVLFDCAGLTGAPTRCSADRRPVEMPDTRYSILDELAQQAAIEALRKASVVLFCIDISKDPRLKTQDFGLWSEEIGLWSSVCSLGSPALISVATKSDLLSEDTLAKRLAELNELFHVEFLPTSVKTGVGLEQLRKVIDKKLMEKFEFRNSKFEIPHVSGVALTARHKQAVTEAIEDISESISELKAGTGEPRPSKGLGEAGLTQSREAPGTGASDQTGVPPAWEVTAMMLRAAYQALSGLQQHIDEQILERIFSRFCIGK